MANGRGVATTRVIVILLGAAVALLAILVLGDFLRGGRVTFDSPYQAVFLTNGQVYFGRLEKVGSPYPVLTEVYYVQSQVKPDTKEARNILVRRGKEWHGPDRMVLSAQQILFIEPVGPESTVAKLIAELKKQ